MLTAHKNTIIVSSTDLKRHYKKVQNYLKDRAIIIITNKNNVNGADGILLPYSTLLIDKLDDILEDLEMEQNKLKLEKEFEESYNSDNKKRIPLEEI